MRVAFVMMVTGAAGVLNGTPVALAKPSSLCAKPFVRSLHLTIPRGGAIVPKTTGSTVMRGGAKQTTKKSIKLPSWLTAPRFPWLVCTLLSLYYFFLYTKQGPGMLLNSLPQDTGDFYKQGFCVTGLDKIRCKLDDPDTVGKCFAAIGNSHQFAWGIDLIYTLVALALPFTNLCKTDLSPALIGIAVVFAGIIFGHGFLHRLISSQECCGSGDMGSYALYVFILMVVDLFGFSCVPTLSHGILISLVAAAILTFLVLKATVTPGASGSVAAFFMISQLVVSVTGLLVPNSNTVTPILGWFFILPNLVSLVEYADCSNFLVQYGGHSWYDFFLHLSFIVSLVFGNYKLPPWEGITC